MLNEVLVPLSINHDWGLEKTSGEEIHTNQKFKSVEWPNILIVRQRNWRKHESSSSEKIPHEIIHHSFLYSMSTIYLPPKRPKTHKNPKKHKHPQKRKHPPKPPQNIDNPHFPKPEKPTKSHKHDKPTSSPKSTDNHAADNNPKIIPTFIQCPHQPKSSKKIEIHFIYSVETKGEDVHDFLKTLEWAMMKRIAEKMMPCSSVDSDGQGVVRVDSSPIDSVLTKCEPSQTDASLCQQLIGEMSVHVMPYEKAENATIAMIRNLIQSDCKNDYYVKDIEISPDLVKVNYIGDGDSPIDLTVSPDTQGKTEPAKSTLLAASLAPVAFLGLLAATLFGVRKRTVSTGVHKIVEDGQKSFILSVSDPSLSEASSEWDHGRARLYGVFGNTYSTHNVHACKSATCQLCYSRKSSIQFIQAPKLNHQANQLSSIIEEDDDNVAP